VATSPSRTDPRQLHSWPHRLTLHATQPAAGGVGGGGIDGSAEDGLHSAEPTGAAPARAFNGPSIQRPGREPLSTPTAYAARGSSCSTTPNSAAGRGVLGCNPRLETRPPSCPRRQTRMTLYGARPTSGHRGLLFVAAVRGKETRIFAERFGTVGRIGMLRSPTDVGPVELRHQNHRSASAPSTRRPRFQSSGDLESAGADASAPEPAPCRGLPAKPGLPGRAHQFHTALAKASLARRPAVPAGSARKRQARVLFGEHSRPSTLRQTRKGDRCSSNPGLSGTRLMADERWQGTDGRGDSCPRRGSRGQGTVGPSA